MYSLCKVARSFVSLGNIFLCVVIMATPKAVNIWTVDDVCTWLQAEGLTQWEEKFQEHEVDGACLLELTAADLESDIGVTKMGPRKSILRCIQKLLPTDRAEEGKLANQGHDAVTPSPQLEVVSPPKTKPMTKLDVLNQGVPVASPRPDVATRSQQALTGELDVVAARATAQHISASQPQKTQCAVLKVQLVAPVSIKQVKLKSGCVQKAALQVVDEEGTSSRIDLMYQTAVEQVSTMEVDKWYVIAGLSCTVSKYLSCGKEFVAWRPALVALAQGEDIPKEVEGMHQFSTIDQLSAKKVNEVFHVDAFVLDCEAMERDSNLRHVVLVQGDGSKRCRATLWRDAAAQWPADDDAKHKRVQLFHMRAGEYKGTVQLSSTQESFIRFADGEQFEEDARHTCSSVLSSGIFILSDRQALRLDAWKEQPADSSKPYVTKCSLTKLEVHVYKACPMCAGRVEPTFVVGQNFQCTKCSHQCDGSFEESYISVVITGACAGGVQEELTGKSIRCCGQGSH
jgi:hypothetical protein